MVIILPSYMGIKISHYKEPYQPTRIQWNVNRVWFMLLKCAMVKSRYIGDGHPTFNRNPYNGYINPYYWVDEFIPYYMEIMGVDRPWHKWW